MENEKIDGVEEELSIPPEVPEGEEDNTDWRALAQKNYGIAQRYKTKLEKSKEVKPEAKPEAEAAPVKPGFDYGELAFYNSKSNSVKIEAEEDIEFLKQQMEETGKSQSAILNSKWFQGELQERKDAKTTKEAIPRGTKRSPSSGRDTVEYWMAQVDSGKAKLSDISDVKLRREVNNARSKASEDTNKFAPQSVVIGGK